MKKKIAFIRVYKSVPIALSVPRMLCGAFPEYEIETITITELLKQRIDILLINSFITIREHGLKVLSRRATFRKAFLRTPYIFGQVKRLLAERLSPKSEEFEFSFQLQSLFDCSVPGLAHFVYTDHTHLANLEYTDFTPAALSSHPWLLLEEEVYRNAERIFTRSTNISRSLEQHYGISPEKVTCVFAGTNVMVDDTEIRHDRSAGQNILFVGIDWERKGGPDLVLAFQKLLAKHPQASLTIIGCNPLVDLPNTSILGRLPVEELSQYYLEADIFCLPTHLEPFGIAFIEALSYGLPIIATDIGAIPDFVIEGVNGFTVPAGNIDMLAARLIELVGDNAMQQEYGRNSLKLADERYNWQSVGNAIRQQIDEDLNLALESDAGKYLDYMRIHPEVYV